MLWKISVFVFISWKINFVHYQKGQFSLTSKLLKNHERVRDDIYSGFQGCYIHKRNYTALYDGGRGALIVTLVESNRTVETFFNSLKIFLEDY